jgi:hypothetical protein
MSQNLDLLVESWGDDPVVVALLDAALWLVEAAARRKEGASLTTICAAVGHACNAAERAEDMICDDAREVQEAEAGIC